MFRTAAITTRVSLSRATRMYARSLHSSPGTSKSMTEKVSEVADTVNKKVGKGIASAIETGEHATHTTKEKFGSGADSTKEKVEDVAGTAKQKVQETSEQARQKADQAKSGAREAKDDVKKELSK
ncbi:hypothetical protein SERLA73DRAFT_131175 [Serpula lacrymans var. lacrymans S7.3]|uniref:Uncharacterized protein n=2 Tax=Serpula lacrymans var. lacrymans TaxID=341189 RepID=F8PMJ6_SERL3|nr:uncharacterized protein SERLADRAFT_380309 [Serpula lacrymans var. lacrymans S7.9]EGO02828.1 hypothetical protein SERLA73DRAFT_131175 [Serpula lacrymans var. lacrymans S7.3]EGO28526.1 hypothetical protein SERLADRAFT_380309 [Serpula lacrymans var. lacrymans S7.9]